MTVIGLPGASALTQTTRRAKFLRPSKRRCRERESLQGLIRNSLSVVRRHLLGVRNSTTGDWVA